MGKTLWVDFSTGRMMDEFQARAEKDSGYAIAWALCQLAEQQRRTAEALDRLGTNNGSPQGGPGTTEFIGMEVKRIADALEQWASRPLDE